MSQTALWTSMCVKLSAVTAAVQPGCAGAFRGKDHQFFMVWRAKIVVLRRRVAGACGRTFRLAALDREAAAAAHVGQAGRRQLHVVEGCPGHARRLAVLTGHQRCVPALQRPLPFHARPHHC